MRKSFSIAEEQAQGRQPERIVTTSAALLRAPESNAAPQARPSGGISLLPCRAELPGDAVVPLKAKSSAAPRGGYASSERGAAELAHDARNLLSALNLYCELLAGPAVRLEVECAPCAGLLGLNAEELLRILFNLVANAVEAMGALTGAPGRQGFLRITAQRAGGASFLPSGADGVETVVLSVRDNGPGIAANDLDRIFDAGFSTRVSGDEAPHGLGLSIVRQLVEAAGGAVRAVSSPAFGARFDIEIPVLAERMALRPELTVRGGQREPTKRSNG